MPINLKVPVKTKAEVATESLSKVKANLEKVQKTVSDQLVSGEYLRRLQETVESHIRDTAAK